MCSRKIKDICLMFPCSGTILIIWTTLRFWVLSIDCLTLRSSWCFQRTGLPRGHCMCCRPARSPPWWGWRMSSRRWDNGTSRRRSGGGRLPCKCCDGPHGNRWWSWCLASPDEKKCMYSCPLQYKSHCIRRHAKLFSKACLDYKTCHTNYSKARLEYRTQQPSVDITMTSSLLWGN